MKQQERHNRQTHYGASAEACLLWRTYPAEVEHNHENSPYKVLRAQPVVNEKGPKLAKES